MSEDDVLAGIVQVDIDPFVRALAPVDRFCRE
jgi:hypothetical protein